MASEEEDFPRGGATRKPSESKPAVEQVDNLFQSHVQTETKKRKGSNKADGKKFKKQKAEETIEDSLTLNTAARSVEILHLRNVKEGMLFLGCVKEVTDFEVTVSLPCGLQGFLSIKNICDSYTKLLSKQLDSGMDTEVSLLPGD